MTDQQIREWQLLDDQAQQAKRTRELLDASNAPWGLWPQGGPVGREWAATCRKAGSFMVQGAIVVIGGPWGTGKTTMGLALIRRACELGQRAYYTKASLMLRDLSRPLRFDESIAGFMGTYTRPWLLVIDELNTERLRSWDVGMLSESLDERYAGRRNTVLLTNHDQDVFADLVGSSVVDRLNERGTFIWCDWRSYRGDQQ